MVAAVVANSRGGKALLLGHVRHAHLEATVGSLSTGGEGHRCSWHHKFNANPGHQQLRHPGSTPQQFSVGDSVSVCTTVLYSSVFPDRGR